MGIFPPLKKGPQIYHDSKECQGGDEYESPIIVKLDQSVE